MTNEDYKECHNLAETFILDMDYKKMNSSGDVEDWYRECVLEWAPCLDPEEYSDEEVQEYALEAERAVYDHLQAHGEAQLLACLNRAYAPAASKIKRVMGAYRSFMREQLRLLFGDKDGFSAWVREDTWC